MRRVSPLRFIDLVTVALLPLQSVLPGKFLSAHKKRKRTTTTGSCLSEEVHKCGCVVIVVRFEGCALWIGVSTETYLALGVCKECYSGSPVWPGGFLRLPTVAARGHLPAGERNHGNRACHK